MGFSGSTTNEWRKGLILFGLSAAGLIAIYWQTVWSIVEIWMRSDTYSYGLIIIPLSIYMMWSRRDILDDYRPSADFRALPLILGASLIWTASNAVHVLYFQQVMLVVMIWGMIWAILGLGFIRLMLFPVLYLYFLVPLGESLVPMLQDVTSVITVKGLQLSGVPVYLEGRYISIPTGDFEVAKACSGVRYLWASIALGATFAYLNFRSYKKRILFLAICVIVPILANGVRAYGIVMLAHLSNMRLAVGVDHFIYGWIFFGIVMLAVFLLGNVMRGPEDRAGEPVTQKINSGSRREDMPRKYASGLMSIALAATGPMAIANFSAVDESLQDGFTISIPEHRGDWRGPETTSDRWMPEFEGATEVIRKKYSGPEGYDVELFVAVYMTEKQGAELINSSNKIYDGGVWRRSTEKSIEIEDESISLTDVIEVGMQGPTGRRLVWYWYDIGGYQTTNAVLAKMVQALHRIAGNPALSSIVAISTNYVVYEKEARQRLSAFWRAIGADLNSTLAADPGTMTPSS